MAMLSYSATMLPSVFSTAVAGSCMLPAAQHAMHVIRHSSFMSLTAPKPVQEEQSKPSSGCDGHDTVFTWTFAPLARELTRAAGGFEHRATWPLKHGGNTLLDMPLNGSATARSLRSTSSTAFSFASSFSRPYSSLSSEPVHAQQCHEYTSAATLELPAQLQETAAPGVLAAWLPKAQPRLKGFSRKLVLRQVNRKIIARVARRFTIGIPVLGFYFVSKLMVKDYARVKSELSSGQYTVAALFSTALVADLFDLAAQMTIITGMAHANLGVGLASAAAFLVAADKASLATAALSFSCGLSGELLALKRAGELAAGSSSE